jgi:hypothetical protein
VVVRLVQIRRIGWVIKILEAQVSHILLGCKCLVRLSLSSLAKDLSAPLWRQFSRELSGKSGFVISFRYPVPNERCQGTLEYVFLNYGAIQKSIETLLDI